MMNPFAIPGSNRFNGIIDDLHAYLTRTSDGGLVKPTHFDLTTVIGVRGRPRCQNMDATTSDSPRVWFVIHGYASAELYEL